MEAVTSGRSYLELLDYRRRVMELYAEVRALRERDAGRAHLRWRAERDLLFGRHPQSALPAQERARFRGLAYHEYDPAFAFSAAVRPLREERYDVPTSTGGVIPFVRFGAVDLPIGALEVFWLDAYGGGVFLPFRDATSGHTTYGGGRYLLDTAKGADLGSETDRLILDSTSPTTPRVITTRSGSARSRRRRIGSTSRSRRAGPGFPGLSPT